MVFDFLNSEKNSLVLTLSVLYFARACVCIVPVPEKFRYGKCFSVAVKQSVDVDSWGGIFAMKPGQGEHHVYSSFGEFKSRKLLLSRYYQS